MIPFDGGPSQDRGFGWKVTRVAGVSLGDRACLALALQTSLPALTTERDRGKCGLAVEIGEKYDEREGRYPPQIASQVEPELQLVKQSLRGRGRRQKELVSGDGHLSPEVLIDESVAGSTVMRSKLLNHLRVQDVKRPMDRRTSPGISQGGQFVEAGGHLEHVHGELRCNVEADRRIGGQRRAGVVLIPTGLFLLANPRRELFAMTLRMLRNEKGRRSES